MRKLAVVLALSLGVLAVPAVAQGHVLPKTVAQDAVAKKAAAVGDDLPNVEGTDASNCVRRSDHKVRCVGAVLFRNENYCNWFQDVIARKGSRSYYTGGIYAFECFKPDGTKIPDA